VPRTFLSFPGWGPMTVVCVCEGCLLCNGHVISTHTGSFMCSGTVSSPPPGCEFSTHFSLAPFFISYRASALAPKVNIEPLLYSSMSPQSFALCVCVVVCVCIYKKEIYKDRYDRRASFWVSGWAGLLLLRLLLLLDIYAVVMAAAASSPCRYTD
jgi:hypothetical protein